MQNTNNVLYIYLTYFWSLSNLNELFPCYLHGICSLAEKCRTLGSKSCPAHSSDGVVLSSHHAPIFYSTSVARCHSSLACECTRHPATFIQCLHTPPKPRVRHQREYLSNGHSIKCSGVKKKRKEKKTTMDLSFFLFPSLFTVPRYSMTHHIFSAWLQADIATGAPRIFGILRNRLHDSGKKHKTVVINSD